MIQTTLKIDGMMCGMCEAHVNDAIRKTFDVKKVSSSHLKKETVILSENILDETLLTKAIKDIGYELVSYEEKVYQKKFNLFK